VHVLEISIGECRIGKFVTGIRLQETNFRCFLLVLILEVHIITTRQDDLTASNISS